MERRRFLASAFGLIASPAVVRAESLMPISVMIPDWIVNHRRHPVFGELVVRMPNARSLESFHGILRPGQMFWKRDGQLLDLCVFSRTQLDVTPGMLSLQNLDQGGHIDWMPNGMGGVNKVHVYARPHREPRGIDYLIKIG